MWISVVPGPKQGPDLVAPAGLWTGGRRRIAVRYGARSAHVIADSPEGSDPPSLARTERDKPAEVQIAPWLLEVLHIRTEPVYQMRVSPRGLDIGPVLGLLLGTRNHWYDDRFMAREPDRIKPVYRQSGGLICAFSPRSFSVARRCAYGLFYDPSSTDWRYGVLPLPAVAHRRSFQPSSTAVSDLQKQGVQVFNSHRYSKWELHTLLLADQSLVGHVPETLLVTDAAQVLWMVERLGAVVLKPSSLSRGRGIAFVQRAGNAYLLSDCRGEEAPVPKHCSSDELLAAVTQITAEHAYLCQERIDLALVDGAPFDIRVVMQKLSDGAWRCSGIECRLAGAGHLVTNISRGGRALWLDEAVRQAFGGRLDTERTEAEVIDLARRICWLMDHTGNSYAEFGIDLALDRDGGLWFIEANVIPTFNGFLDLDRSVYRDILATPLLYASALAGFGQLRGGSAVGVGSDLPD